MRRARAKNQKIKSPKTRALSLILKLAALFIMANEGGGIHIFVYMGGNQKVPRDVTHVRIHKSVKIIPRRAFSDRRDLVSIEIHDGVEIIEEGAIVRCYSLRGIKLLGVRVIEQNAFYNCVALANVEFGDKLEIIGQYAFSSCYSLRNINIPKVRSMGLGVFWNCAELIDVTLSEDLEHMGRFTFSICPRLRRITLPLNDYVFGDTAFDECNDLSHIELVGWINKDVSSLLLESWRNEMQDEINQINLDLPTVDTDRKTAVAQQWLDRVFERYQYYRSKHYTLLKEGMTLLELALCKTQLLDDTFGEEVDAGIGRDGARITRGQRKRARLDMKRNTCGAAVIIPLVLSFLNDDNAFPLLDYN